MWKISIYILCLLIPAFILGCSEEPDNDTTGQNLAKKILNPLLVDAYKSVVGEEMEYEQMLLKIDKPAIALIPMKKLRTKKPTPFTYVTLDDQCVSNFDSLNMKVGQKYLVKESEIDGKPALMLKINDEVCYSKHGYTAGYVQLQGKDIKLVSPPN